jgi:hypothetical protein
VIFLLISPAIRSHTSFPSADANLPPIFEESGTYISAKDPDYDPNELCDEILALGVDDDDFTYDAYRNLCRIPIGGLSLEEVQR